MFNDTFKGRKVLITGHTGFKGSWLTLWLNQIGAKICGYSSEVFSSPSHFSLLGIEDEIRHEIGDICDYQRLNSVVSEFQPEIIFHLAAQAIVKESLNEPINTFNTNTMGMATLLSVLKKHPNIKATILITSDKVYENKEWPWGYREIDQLGGKDPYSASKAAAELVINSYFKSYFQESNTIISIGRAGNVIGGGDWALDRIVPDCARAWGKNESVVIRNSLSTRPWQHVLEPLSGYLRLAELALKGNQTIQHQAYNFGPNAETNQNVGELVKSMSQRWPNAGWIDETSKMETANAEANLLKLSCEKADKDFGWKPTWNFFQTVTHTIDWYFAFSLQDKFNARTFSEEQILRYCADAAYQKDS